MLVLERELHEEIWINDGAIKIHVVSIKRGKIRLAFDAPKDVQIDRKELALMRWAGKVGKESRGNG